MKFSKKIHYFQDHIPGSISFIRIQTDKVIYFILVFRICQQAKNWPRYKEKLLNFQKIAYLDFLIREIETF